MTAQKIALLILILTMSVLAQEGKQEAAMKDCPMHAQHSSHHAAVESHGDQAMGFPHDKTTHHFRVMANGGAIEVSANDPGDKENRESVRTHLKHIATMFTDGDFSIPMFIHDGIPPGTTTMKLMKAAIHYQYEEMPSGGRVRITTQDPIAVAVHDFLRFQIAEHGTGDTVSAPQDAH